MDKFKTTLTNSEAFEKWYKNSKYQSSKDNTRFYLFEGWRAAQAESAKEIAELKKKHTNQLAEIITAAFGYFKNGDPIHHDYDTVALRNVASLYEKYDLLFKENLQLKADNERLREALEIAKISSCSCLTKTHEHEYHDKNCRYRIYCEALSATTSSLVEHDNEMKGKE